MSEVREIAGAVLLAGGAAFMLVGSIGILRLPDFYSRTHAASKIDTMGILLLLTGLIVMEASLLTIAKLVLIVFFVAIANPVAAHALAGAALGYGLKPWTRKRPETKG